MATLSESLDQQAYQPAPHDLGTNDLWHLDFHLPTGLFDAVAGNRDQTIFPDGKAIVDSEPKYPLGQIIADYAIAAASPDFRPTAFFVDHFKLPKYEAPETKPDVGINEYITKMWDELSYHSQSDKGTLIGTPNTSLRSGERFSESYYWDLSEGIRGLLVEAKRDAHRGNKSDQQRKEALAVGIADNFVYQIDRFGYIPNGLRSYYLGRSQPPVFMEIVKQLQAHFGDRKPHIMENYLPALTKEYDHWMTGERVVELSRGKEQPLMLNRHWDDNEAPRPESYAEDIATARLAGGDPRSVYKHIRVAASSGRDFTARWMRDPDRLETIHAADFVTPELNAQLYYYETEIANAHAKAGRSKLKEEFEVKAEQRQLAVNTYLWSDVHGGYFDYDFVNNQASSIRSMGMAYPVALGLASPYQAKVVSRTIEKHLLKDWGFISTDIKSKEQWDYQNGWPVDQIKAIQALTAAGHVRTAVWGAFRWLELNRSIFEEHHSLVEKSNVVQKGPGSGGEYDKAQRDFLWSNGVDRVLRDFIQM